MTRTLPRSGARSKAALRTIASDVPNGYSSGGTMTPSSNPR